MKSKKIILINAKCCYPSCFANILCICVRFQSEQMVEDGEALSCWHSALSRKAGFPIRDFTVWQPVEGCDLQGSVRSVALWLPPHSSLFSCDATHSTVVVRSFTTQKSGYCYEIRLVVCLSRHNTPFQYFR